MRVWVAVDDFAGRRRVRQWLGGRQRRAYISLHRLLVRVDWRRYHGYAVTGIAPYVIAAYGGTVLGHMTEVERAMKRRAVAGPGAMSRTPASTTSKVMLRFPNLLMSMASLSYDDGSARKPGWVTIRTNGQTWQLIVKDPDSCSFLTATASTLDDALILAEQLVSSEDAAWEHDEWAAARIPTKRKR